MTGFLTVEDVNSAINRDGVNGYIHTVDTSLITRSTSNYSDVTYDFVTISRTWNSTTEKYSFELIVHSSSWTGVVGVHDGSWVNKSNVTVNQQNSSISFSISKKDVKIFLYCTNLNVEFNHEEIRFIVDNPVWYLKLDEVGTTKKVTATSLVAGGSAFTNSVLNLGLNSIQIVKFAGYVLGVLQKTDFEFNCTQSLIVGKINKVSLGTDSKYKPNGDLVGSYTPAITVQYGEDILPVTYDGTDYSFNLDLTDKTEAGKVRFKVLVEANEVLNSSETEIVLTSQYQTISTFDSLVTACGSNGADIIRLGANLTATSNISIHHSIKIIGTEHTIDLDRHRFILDEGVTFNAENITFDNGDTTIIQAKNTKVELTGCTFNNCTSSNYNGLGSCIFCDVDVDSLQITNDYETILTNCTFTDNTNCILHGGELTVIGCTLENDDTTNINTNNVAFVYQTDGTCLIQQSTFTINYDYTSAEANIGFAQALVMCGETAQINGASYAELGDNDTLPFFEAPFNNRAELTAEYYYPQISANVESVGIISGKACCHAVSGVDWVFKDNVTVRRLE